jgi:hypothetical protein
MPDEAHLAILSLIEETFLSARHDGEEILRIDLIRSLCEHKFPQTVPLLAPFVMDDFSGNEVEAALSAIVGQDLGETPQSWLDWYAQKAKPHDQN